MRYDYGCKECGHEWEDFRLVAERNNIDCPECGGECKILIGRGHTSTALYAFRPYVDEHISDDGPTLIESRQQRRDLMKQNDLVEAGKYGENLVEV